MASVAPRHAVRPTRPAASRAAQRVLPGPSPPARRKRSRMNRSHATRILLVQGLFLVSGFCGLIYESIWSHYLKLFLGHAAYAQTLVLVIFMGGMAIGAWACSNRSRLLARPLMAYAGVEAVLG